MVVGRNLKIRTRLHQANLTRYTRHKILQTTRKIKRLSKDNGAKVSRIKDTSGIGVNRPGAFAEFISLPVTNVWVHDPADGSHPQS